MLLEYRPRKMNHQFRRYNLATCSCAFLILDYLWEELVLRITFISAFTTLVIFSAAAVGRAMDFVCG